MTEYLAPPSGESTQSYRNACRDFSQCEVYKNTETFLNKINVWTLHKQMRVKVCPCACAASPGKRLDASCLSDLKTSHMRGGQLELDCVIDVKTLCT